VIITIAGADPPVAGVTGKVAALVPTPPEVVVTTTGPADGPGGDTVHVTSDGEIHTMGAHTWPATLTDEISPGPEPKLEPVIVICVDWPAGKVPGSTARITGTGTGAAEGTAEGTAEGATEGATVPLDEPTTNVADDCVWPPVAVATVNTNVPTGRPAAGTSHVTSAALTRANGVHDTSTSVLVILTARRSADPPARSSPRCAPCRVTTVPPVDVELSSIPGSTAETWGPV
jgi:hypothetical protein